MEGIDRMDEPADTEDQDHDDKVDIDDDVLR